MAYQIQTKQLRVKLFDSKISLINYFFVRISFIVYYLQRLNRGKMIEKEIAEEMVKCIIHEMKKLIGKVAITVASDVKGVEIKNHKTVLITGEDSTKVVSDLIKSYQSIMGTGARPFVIEGIISVIKKHKIEIESLKKELPSWVFESPDIKILELAGPGL